MREDTSWNKYNRSNKDTDERKVKEKVDEESESRNFEVFGNRKDG